MTSIYIPDFEEFIVNSTTYSGTAASVAASIETDLVVVTIPSDSNFIILGGTATGMTDTIFKLYVGGTLKETLHNAWTDRNVTFKTKHKVSANTEIKITVEHTSTVLHDFYGTIIGSFI